MYLVSFSVSPRDVIDDKDFVKELDRLKSEPIPYFAMIPRQEEDQEDDDGLKEEEEEAAQRMEFDPVEVCEVVERLHQKIFYFCSDINHE